ncbi:DUF1269 domain-containing protein [Planomonospora parontospora]|uniref:DUF1269 domain-containing protein n=1 Tax=Planomonospora parontospora TaxID=58119 RepID=UPI001671429F|nr:DUF1269 domain-containing protein [Planomonospora parontospora]GGL27017.1 membrane protein [Planomonospora parontospora subsp. antibiotica]GII16575.1 membrane protein [Planomonospora parontospora subsp. antibiotica]
MSHLIAVAYPDVATAQAVRGRLTELQQQNLITLEDAVVVERRQDGKIKLHQATSMTGLGASSGALWGGLIGMLFFMPLFGMALGAAAGAASGAMSDVGVDDDFMRQLATRLEPGTAALLALVVRSTPDKVIPEISSYGGHIIQTSLSNEAEAHLRETVQAARAGHQ